MQYSFDEVIDRGSQSGSYSCKWEHYASLFPGYQIDKATALPMWVADMDFRTMPQIIEALHQRVEHGIFGYVSDAGVDVFKEAACGWFARRYGFTAKKEQMLFSMGLVCAVNNAVQEFSGEGDGVIIQSPVYYPFGRAITNNRRVIVENTLLETEHGYVMNLEQLAKQVADPNNKMLILCSPHNPVGRVWSREELQQVLSLCAAHDVMVFCDEIHADLIMPGVTFVSAGTMPEYYDHLILAHSPSKTFNLAGLCASLLTVPKEENRRRLENRLYNLNHVPSSHNMGPLAGSVAYRCGDAYADELMQYIAGNVRYAEEFLAQNLPQITMSKLEGTYLTWFDFRKTGLDETEINRRVLEQAGVIGDLGSWFGETGRKFVRFNYACPRVKVEEQLQRLQRAFSK